MVFLGHYLGIYKYSQVFSTSIQVIDSVEKSFFYFLIDEGFWVHLFFVISGYLASKTLITDTTILLSKIVKRFMRLALPIFFSGIIIFLIYIFIGFYNAETSCLFKNVWYQQQFYNSKIGIIDILLSPFTVILLGDNRINGPYWVMPMMFLSSSVIYLLNYFFNKLKNTHKEIIQCIIETTFIIACAFVFPILSAHIIGMLVSEYEDHFKNIRFFYTCCALIIVISAFFLPRRINESLSFGIIILLCPHLKILNKLLSVKIFQFLDSISWGIFSFHWPLIYSVGALVLISFSQKTNLNTAFFIGFVTVSLLTICISIIFNKSFEKISMRITNNIYNFCLNKINIYKK